MLAPALEKKSKKKVGYMLFGLFYNQIAMKKNFLKIYPV
jgi:hypothetical protein